MQYSNTMKIKLCIKCKRPREPSSRQFKCSRCRAEIYKHPCKDCGKPVHHNSQRCFSCAHAKIAKDALGLTRHKKGYIYIRVGSKYRPQHAVILEQHLGRKLFSSERVHHRNGIKDDNHLNNLELWASNHPAGARVTDLLQWARHLIKTYKPIEALIQ